ncbi:Os09g0361366, partial [Oryza sativa Japonica Group]
MDFNPGVSSSTVTVSHTFESEFAFTSTVMFLFFICDWISPKIRSAFFVLSTYDAIAGVGGEGELVVGLVVPVQQIPGLLADLRVQAWPHHLLVDDAMRRRIACAGGRRKKKAAADR